MAELDETIVVIPARLAASRLANKPLADIAGAPMIIRVVEQAIAAAIGPVLVAAGDQQIVDAVESAGHCAVLTDPALPSGTDRVLAALDQIDTAARYKTVVNLQGDMPLIDPAAIALAVQALNQVPEADIATLVSPTNDPKIGQDPNVVKAIVAGDGNMDPARCLYFTRAAAPGGSGPIWQHVGLYVYRRAALAAFVAAPPSPLEQRERLEQLRALENGMMIVAAQTAVFPKGVDTADNLEAARLAWGERVSA